MLTSSKLLFNDPPLVVSPSLAVALKSVDEALVLQQVHYWLQTASHEREGRRWIYNSVKEWQAQFPFWSEKVIRRIIESLRDKGLLLTANYNKLPMDRTLWYSIDYEALDTYAQMGEPFARQVHTICPPGVNHLPARGKAIPETTTENTTEREGYGRARDYRNQAHVTADGYTQEAKRLGIATPDFVAMCNLLLDAAGWTYLVDAGDDRKLDYAKQAAIAMIKMGDDSPDKLQAIIDLWKQANDWRNSPPKPDDIAQYASQLRAGVATRTNGKQGRTQRKSKVQMSLEAVDRVVAMAERGELDEWLK